MKFLAKAILINDVVTQKGKWKNQKNLRINCQRKSFGKQTVIFLFLICKKVKRSEKVKRIPELEIQENLGAL